MTNIEQKSADSDFLAVHCITTHCDNKQVDGQFYICTVDGVADFRKYEKCFKACRFGVAGIVGRDGCFRPGRESAS